MSRKPAHAEPARLCFPSASGRMAAIVVLGILARSAGAQAVCYEVHVDPASSLQTVSVNQPVTLTATVTNRLNPDNPGLMAGGAVTFLDNGSPISGGTVPVDQNGTASLITAFGTTGVHVVTGVSSWRICDSPSTSSSISVTVLPNIAPTPAPPSLLLVLTGLASLLARWAWRRRISQ